MIAGLSKDFHALNPLFGIFYFLTSLSALIINRRFPSIFISDSSPLALNTGRTTGFLFILIGFTILFFQIFLATPKLFSTIDENGDISSPFDNFFVEFGMDGNNSFGIVSLISHSKFPEFEAIKGAHLLGFSDKQALSLIENKNLPDCYSHPLARPLPGMDNSYLAKEQWSKNSINLFDNQKLITLFSELSKEIFNNSNNPVTIWQFLLESFRAEEIHEINPSASFEITPFIIYLYSNAAQEKESIIYSKNTFQSGVRTSQGIAGVMCGMGTLPYNLSFARDLGLLPMRCLPDVLVDASFNPRLFYGSNLNFDGMKRFFEYHGVTLEEKQFIKDSSKGGWGISDRVVFKKTIEVSKTDSCETN